MAVPELVRQEGLYGQWLNGTMAMTVSVYKDLYLKLKSSVSIS
jgi:hypothetical protein